jgi:uncharacterized membrane protein (Fun14 family)
MLSMVALEVLQQAETILTQSNPPDLELLIHLISNMEESKLELSFQKVTGFGQLFGYFHNITLMVVGLHLVKLIWLNQEETIVTEKLEVQTLSVQLFTLVQIGNMMLMKKLLNNTNTPNHSVMISMFTVLNGMNLVLNQQLMEMKFWISHLMNLYGQRVISQKVCTTHGNMKLRRVLHLTNHTI